MAEFVPKGMLTVYRPAGWDKIPAKFKDPDGYWTAIDTYEAALVVNTKVMEEKKLPMPKGWKDLLNPVYKGMLIMPNPAVPVRGSCKLPAFWSLWIPTIKTSRWSRIRPEIS